MFSRDKGEHPEQKQWRRYKEKEVETISNVDGSDMRLRVS